MEGRPSALWVELERERQRRRSLEQELGREKREHEKTRCCLVQRGRYLRSQVNKLELELRQERTNAERKSASFHSYKQKAAKILRENEDLLKLDGSERKFYDEARSSRHFTKDYLATDALNVSVSSSRNSTGPYSSKNTCAADDLTQQDSSPTAQSNEEDANRTAWIQILSGIKAEREIQLEGIAYQMRAVGEDIRRLENTRREDS